MTLPKTDFHVHSFLKPYGHSKYKNNNPMNAYHPASAWYTDKGTKEDFAIENTIGFAPYRQSDLSSCRRSNFRLVVNSLYPVEKGFFDIKDTVMWNSIEKIAGRWLENFITDFGKVYIDEIKSAEFNYFDDLIKQLDHIQALHAKVPINGSSRYEVLNTGQHFDTRELEGNLLIINTIEGAHSFCNGNDPTNATQWEGVEERIKKVKAHPGRPFFVTMAHHFYNGLTSHCESLFAINNFIKGQHYGMKSLVKPPRGAQICDKEITPNGYKVINSLLSTTNGPRIFIDIKHMSAKARYEFYTFRTQSYPELPIIYSHGGCEAFYKEEINLSKTDIVEIAKSGGLIGLEMDQRVMGYDAQHKGRRFDRWYRNAFRRDTRQNELWAEPIWNNMMEVAETCYKAGSDPWKHICIGSDYDGIINPLNEYRTVSETDELLTCLHDFLADYWSLKRTVIPKNTGGNPSDIIYQIGYKNTVNFVKEHFK